jgi:hypothetical protein
MIRIQNHECTSMAEVRCQARGMPKAEAAKAIQAMRTSLSIRQHRRREAGLAPFDAAERRGRREWRAAMKAMGQTRATTTRGVILKLKLIALELRDGHTGYGEAIIASAIADLSRIGRKTGNASRTLVFIVYRARAILVSMIPPTT